MNLWTFRWCLLLGYSIISTGICIRIPDEAPSQYPVLLDEVQGLLPKIWDLEFPLHVQAMDWTIHWLDMKRKLKSQILTWCCDDCDTADVQDYMFIDFMFTPPPTPTNDCPKRKLAPNFSILERKRWLLNQIRGVVVLREARGLRLPSTPLIKGHDTKGLSKDGTWSRSEENINDSKWQRNITLLVLLQSLVTSINPTKRLTNLAKTLCHLRIKKSPMFGAAAITRTSM